MFQSVKEEAIQKGTGAGGWLGFLVYSLTQEGGDTFL
jgi:hypothetical protein